MDMPRLSLCIEPILKELPLTDRIRIAADAGFEAVEFWEPAGKDLAGLAAAASASGVAIIACLLNEAWANPLSQPSDRSAANLRRSIDKARELGCRTLIGLSGNESGSPDVQKADLIENLKPLADLLIQADMTLVLEPLNSRIDHKGYFLDSSATAFEVVRTVGCPNIRILYDVYHMQVMEGNLLATITDNLDWIGHFHAAGVPGRHEPMMGEIHYPWLLERIDALGYDRHVGLEYWPTYDHRQSIADCRTHMQSRSMEGNPI